MATRASRRPARPAPRRKVRRVKKPAHALRWIGLVVLLAVAVGYVQPLRAYRDATANVTKREAEVERIASANVRLGQSIEETATPEFVERQARKLGLVKPGERLYIVTGIDEWRQERQGRSEAGIR
jgi:cell division protein FtsB